MRGDDRRQESDEVDSTLVETEKESRQDGDAKSDAESDDDSEDFVVSMEETSKEKADTEVSRTHSNGTTGSDYSVPVSPWADLRNMLTAVKRGKQSGSKQEKAKKVEPKVENADSEPVKNAKPEETKHQIADGENSSPGSAVSDNENYVEFSSDQEKGGSSVDDNDDDTNPYLDDGDDTESGTNTPRLQELSESAAIAMTDLRSMLFSVNTKLKKETDTAKAVKAEVVVKSENEDATVTIMGYEADQEEMAEDDDSQCSSIFLRKTSSLLNDTNELELAHKFAEHTYKAPTNCGICNGLLVGLWSQGLQCEICGLNVRIIDHLSK